MSMSSSDVPSANSMLPSGRYSVITGFQAIPDGGLSPSQGAFDRRDTYTGDFADPTHSLLTS